MKLLSHNMLTSHGLKGVSHGYPLKIMPKDVRIEKSEFNKEFISRIVPKVNWPVLLGAAKDVGHDNELPDKLIDDYEDNEAFLKQVHHLLLEIVVIEGELVCPETSRKFPIQEGIPNLLLKEDEI